MLAKKLKLKINSLEVGTTPLLVPSMSSHINVEYNETIEALSAIVDGPMLISAYDYYYAEGLSINYPDLIFLDSGGYECNKDKEISDSGFYKPQEIDWTRTIHAKVVNEWSNEIPTVVISYDHPSERYPIKGQIKLAKELFENKNDVIKEILLKPVSQDAIRVKPEQVIENLNQLSYFDIVGFTDKELGFSVFKRMENIAKIRKAIKRV